MKIQLTQAELVTALEFYLNKELLTKPVTIDVVKKDTSESGTHSPLCVIVIAQPEVHEVTIT